MQTPIKKTRLQNLYYKCNLKNQGANAYEDLLIKSQRSALSKYLHFSEIHGSDAELILKYFDHKVTRENIKQLYAHPIDVFAIALCNNTLKSLLNCSSAKFNNKLAPELD